MEEKGYDEVAAFAKYKITFEKRMNKAEKKARKAA